MRPRDFRRQYPGLFFLDAEDVPSLSRYLGERQLLEGGETVLAISRAGAGNMNCTMRVTTDRRTFVVKQSRPWVEKYPQIAAPWDRARREAEFYGLARGVPDLAARMPGLWFADPIARVLVLEDVGSDSYVGVYRGDALGPTELDVLADFLTTLHRSFAPCSPRPRLANDEMRALNHRHTFVIPLQRENGLDLDAVQPGLQFAADHLKSDAAYCAEVERLGRECYLADGPCLVHGDFYLGGFVRSAAGPRVIDPEFGFFGRPEYDVGVLLAHLFLAGLPPASRGRLLRRYVPPQAFEETLMLQLAGVEIMRRLIGYAQLPLAHDLRGRRRLLEVSRELVSNPRPATLDVV
jgi:5-methylthioribose kinase